MIFTSYVLVSTVSQRGCCAEILTSSSTDSGGPHHNGAALVSMGLDVNNIACSYLQPPEKTGGCFPYLHAKDE